MDFHNFLWYIPFGFHFFQTFSGEKIEVLEVFFRMLIAGQNVQKSIFSHQIWEYFFVRLNLELPIKDFSEIIQKRNYKKKVKSKGFCHFVFECDHYCAKQNSEMWIKKILSEKGTNQPEVKNTSNHLLSTSGKNCVNFVDSSIFREFWGKNCNVLQLYRFLPFLRYV